LETDNVKNIGEGKRRRGVKERRKKEREGKDTYTAKKQLASSKSKVIKKAQDKFG